MKNICDWNSCNKLGEYKAPVERDNSRKYRLLCLEHIREFNKIGIILEEWMINRYLTLLNLILLGISQPKVSVHQIIFLKYYGIMLLKMRVEIEK